jgi:hypothetical protein
MHDSYLSDKLAQRDRDFDDEVTLIEQYIDKYKVTFELRAINDDGEVLAKVSSNGSAYDVSTQYKTIDTAIYELARQDQINRDEYLTEMEAENFIEQTNERETNV